MTCGWYPHCVSLGIKSTSFSSREEMYEARPLSRSLFLYTFLQNHGPSFLDEQVVGVPGVTNILEFHPEVSPHR